MGKAQVVIDKETQKNIDSWLKGDFDEASKEEIKRLQRENPEELLDAFYTHLDFGTGGLRGIMGVGTNRMNVYTVRAATQGLANYISKQPLEPEEKGHRVLIGYDNRNHSREFAEESARVLSANGIDVFLYKEIRPVALISFGVLYLKCIAGILITASHNPPKYNGYKVYWNYGGQVLPPHDKGIIDEVNKITSNKMVKIESLPTALVEAVNGEIDEAYMNILHSWCLHPGDNHSKGKELKIVYTPLYGTGITILPKAFKDWGFTNYSLVEEQSTPDGNFPTLKKPNPEEKEALSLGVEKLKKTKADLLIATDPDADRLGVVVMHEGSPFYLNGNEVACLLLEHVVQTLKNLHEIHPKSTVVKTIVTTELFKKIAEENQINCLDVLTGFKYIGEKIAQWEEEKLLNLASHFFIMGAEESYGYLIGTHVRDKDAIISSLILCEAALQLKLQGKTLVDFLYEIYLKYGVYRERLDSFTFEGKEGADKIKQMMQKLRKESLKTIGGKKVEVMEDYLSHISLNLESGSKHTLTLPKSDVLRFWLEDQTKVVIRPSGTEPKIKVYVGVYEKHHENDVEAMKQAIASCDKKLDTLLIDLKKLLLG